MSGYSEKLMTGTIVHSPRDGYRIRGEDGNVYDVSPYEFDRLFGGLTLATNIFRGQSVPENPHFVGRGVKFIGSALELDIVGDPKSYAADYVEILDK